VAGELYDATKARDSERVLALLEAGADPNERSPYDTPLHIAARLGSTSVIIALLGAGADIEITGFGGMRPLHSAALAGQTKAVTLLLAKGAVVDSRDNNNRTPLLTLASGAQGEIATLNALLAGGANPKLVDGVDMHALDYAATRGDLDQASALVAAGADVNSSVDGMSPLHFAIAGYGHFRAGPRILEVVQFLIDRGADVNARDHLGLTPLDYAKRAAPNGGLLHQILLQAGAK
jgi:ankyrin repeat protein